MNIIHIINALEIGGETISRNFAGNQTNET